MRQRYAVQGCDRGDGAVVVGGPETARRDHRAYAAPLLQFPDRELDRGRLVADDARLHNVDAERAKARGEIRQVLFLRAAGKDLVADREERSPHASGMAGRLFKAGGKGRRGGFRGHDDPRLRKGYYSLSYNLHYMAVVSVRVEDEVVQLLRAHRVNVSEVARAALQGEARRIRALEGLERLREWAAPAGKESVTNLIRRARDER
jgi:post-segregation antitoxin (ccd killing protein)